MRHCPLETPFFLLFSAFALGCCKLFIIYFLFVRVFLCKHSRTFIDSPQKQLLCQKLNKSRLRLISSEKRLHSIWMNALPPFAPTQPYFQPFADFLALTSLFTIKCVKMFLRLKCDYVTNRWTCGSASDTFRYSDIICLNVLKYVHYSFTLLHIIKQIIQINIYTLLTKFFNNGTWNSLRPANKNMLKLSLMI